MMRSRTFTGLLLLAVTSFGAPACGAQGPSGEPPPPDPIDAVAGEDLFRQGLALARDAEYLRAEQYIGAAIVRGYPRARALPILLRVCIAASRLRVAIGYAEPYLAEHPEDWSLRLLVASLYLGLEETVKARRELEQVLDAVPAEPEPHYLMAVLLRDEIGDPVGAERHFQRYLELAPEGRRSNEVRHALSTIRIEMPLDTGADPGPDAAPGAPVEETAPTAPEESAE